MAIGYARVEFVKRSGGKTSCAKAAYNSRSRIEFQGNCTLDSEIFDWSSKESPVYHEILLPSGVNDKFKSPQVLWNAVEIKEKKYNSQVAIELLLALPDDKVIILEDRIDLAKTFVQTHFVDKGLAAQIDIHSPEKRIRITRDNREIGVYKEMLGNIISEKENLLTIQFDSKRIISFNPKEFTGFIETENNWHAHVLITTRRFGKSGLEFEDTKARDLMPRICKGKVVSGDDWGKLWTDHQNRFFQEKGLSLRVDALGIEPQDHLGPVRMRGRAFDLLEEHSQILSLNSEKVKDPLEVLQKISERQSIFTKEDVDHFIQKHLSPEQHTAFNELFWKQKELVSLVNKQTGEITGKFCSHKVIEEEASILRLADKLNERSSLAIDIQKSTQFSKALNPEQKLAFDAILKGKQLTCLQGYAGTGKSHLLVALGKTYSDAGYNVRAFGPDNATADVLKEKGFETAENVYRFLYGFYNSKRNAAKNNEIWILDEAGKLGNRPLLEILKAAYKQKAQIILSGDHAQLSSVERGGMFQVFCQRFDSPTLQNIQRQKHEHQREIAKSLAIGETSSALDKLTSASTIKWSSSKKDAFESLISKWAIDTRTNPKASTLLIAHSNDEVRVLNEMVRIIKKQRGELSGKEFSCETFLGKVYLSVGDQIEFRKKDNAIGVANGLSGLLIEADPTKFVVAIGRDGSKSRTVVFNPQEYNSYQLGYASTHYRSQGKTIDMAYVLHSPALNKRLFYVGLTRHSHEAYYFVSKDQAYCLSDLKRQAARENVRENTLSFTTSQAMELLQEETRKQQEIQQLKDSDSFTKKIKGYGLSAYDLVKSKTIKIREHMQDRNLSDEFFNRAFSNPSVSADVKEVEAETRKQPNEVLKVILSQEKSKDIQDQDKRRTEVSNVGHSPLPPDELLAKAKATKRDKWGALQEGKRESIESYFSLASHVAVLRSIVDMETESSDQRLTSSQHRKEWEIACGKRNASAYALIKAVPRDELTGILGKTSVMPISDQATRYQNFIDQDQKTQNLSIETELRANIEPFLYRLFPEGPNQKNKQEFRFGKKGSLSVVCSGDKAGQFYDFERQEGGSMLKLAQRELGLGRLETLEWAKEFLGVVQDIKVPRAFLMGSKGVSKDADWVSVIPDPKVPAPALDCIGTRKLQYYFDETARHSYRDESGQPLYYRLRLINKADPTKKLTPPLSYGYWKNNPNQLSWELKGYDSDKAILYNLTGLKENPLATVLVVEGEKTADKALNKFPNESFVCITWPGGAGAARRADWTHLVGRNVIIWPDNDKSGLQAGEDVCRELRKIGVRSIRMVDPSSLQKHFPEKWDLADPLPASVGNNVLQTILLSALEKGIDPDKVIHRISSQYRPGDPIDRARVNEILWRVDERMRPALEQTMGGQYWKINEIISKETSRLLLKQDQSKNTLKNEQVINECMLHRLVWQTMIYEANYGKSPADAERIRMKDVIQELSSINQGDKLQEFSIDRVLTVAYERSLNGQKVRTAELKMEVISKTQDLERQIERSNFIEKASLIQKDLGKETGLDVKI